VKRAVLRVLVHVYIRQALLSPVKGINKTLICQLHTVWIHILSTEPVHSTVAAWHK